MLRVLVGLAATVIVLVGLSWAREIVGPLALAAVIVIICHPLHGLLSRRGWPRWTATTAVVVLAYVILTAMALLLWFAGNQFARLVVDYLGKLQATVTDIENWLASMGSDQRAADTVSSFLEPTRLLSVATSVSGMVVGVALGLFFVLAYVIFMAADAARYRTLGDESVEKKLSHYVNVRVLEENENAVKTLPKIDGVPTIFFMSADKKVIQKLVGYYDVDDFLSFITTVEEKRASRK